MNHFTDEECRYCGSTMYRRGPHPHCSGDNLEQTQKIFDEVLSFDPDSLEFSTRLSNLQENEETIDLFMSYWSIKKVKPNSRLECIHKDTYFRNLEPESFELPMPPAHTPFPDLAEVYLAEIMLGRELTPNEKDGTDLIPKINEDGSHYRAPLKWILYPKDYMSSIKPEGKTLSLEPLPKVFDINSIRGIYKDGR